MSGHANAIIQPQALCSRQPSTVYTILALRVMAVYSTYYSQCDIVAPVFTGLAFLLHDAHTHSTHDASCMTNCGCVYVGLLFYVILFRVFHCV